MSTSKIIYLHEDRPVKPGYVYAVVHYLVGYNQKTVSDYLKMAKVIQRAFPQAKVSDMQCGCVTKSDYVDGHTLLQWSGVIKKKDRPGWRTRKPSQMDYYHTA